MSVAAIDTVDFIALTGAERIRVIGSSSAAELWRLLERVREERKAGRFIELSWVAHLCDSWLRRSFVEGRDQSALRRNSPDEAERFWAHTIPGLDGCVLWDGPQRFRLNGRGARVPARWVWQHAGRELPVTGPHWTVAPTCGTKSCVNIAHLAVLKVDRLRYTEERMIGRVQVLRMQLGRTPLLADWEKAGCRPVREVIRWRFGTWEGFVKAAGLEPHIPPACTRRYSEEEMLATLRQVMDELGRPPTRTDWRARDVSPNQTTYAKRFGSWKRALELAEAL